MRRYEDEITEVSRNLSESGVQLNFPCALEILLDFTFFDIDEGNSLFDFYEVHYQNICQLLYVKNDIARPSSTASALVCSLNNMCFDEKFRQITKFSEHLSKVSLFNRCMCELKVVASLCLIIQLSHLIPPLLLENIPAHGWPLGRDVRPRYRRLFEQFKYLD